MTFRLFRRCVSPLFLLILLAPDIRGQEKAGKVPQKKKEEARSEEEPVLPEGLISPEEEPSLPEGLEEEAKPFEPEEEPPSPLKRLLPFELSGFWEARFGRRTQSDRYEKETSLAETRLQLEMEKNWAASAFRIKTDLVYDRVTDDARIRLEEGQGWLDLREANLSWTPVHFMDLKGGRQVLTWGTGDLIFINDLFPKDWNSFFIGRDQEYLKAPSDALKASLYSDLANVDLIYTPRFDPDRFIDGTRVSFWNPVLGRQSGRDAPVRAGPPDRWLRDSEAALRVFKNINGYELALYGYRGFWKSPGGTDPLTERATFPSLAVYGASARTAIGRGIGSVEVGYYDSLRDRSGRDPFVKNSEFRFLAGYEQEVARDFTASFQYYLELMVDYRDLKRALPPGSKAAEEDRHVLTLRLTKLLVNQNLKFSLFTYYSPSEGDAYLRPLVHYKINDHWSVEAGGNIFLGIGDHTFFGQFDNNSNLYAGLRFSF